MKDAEFIHIADRKSAWKGGTWPTLRVLSDGQVWISGKSFDWRISFRMNFAVLRSDLSLAVPSLVESKGDLHIDDFSNTSANPEISMLSNVRSQSQFSTILFKDVLEG
jgi:hypothetical protein